MNGTPPTSSVDTWDLTASLTVGLSAMPASATLLRVAINTDPISAVPIEAPRLVAVFCRPPTSAVSSCETADAAVLNIPRGLMGLGLGALASQLGAVTVSAVSEEETAEVGGLQNTATNLGASMGTALIGSVLIATLSSVALAGIADSPTVSDAVKSQVSTELVGGVPFISDAQLTTALESAGVSQSDADAISEINANARLEALQVAFALVGLVAIGALFLTTRIPTVPPGGGGAGSGAESGADPGPPSGGDAAADPAAGSGADPKQGAAPPAD